MTKWEGLPEVWRETVRSEWCDYNDHLNMSYYVLIFDHGTDVFHAQLGLDKNYRLDSGFSTFAVETHTNYLAEIHEADEVCITTQLLDFDEKRLHYFHRMYHADNKFLSATTEIMTVHVDLDERKVVPMADHIQSNVADLYNAHRGLPCPEKAGRRVAIATQ